MFKEKLTRNKICGNGWNHGTCNGHILNIENEHSKVMAYISELEMRRIYLLNRVASLNEDIVMKGVKEKLNNKIMHNANGNKNLLCGNYTE